MTEYSETKIDRRQLNALLRAAWKTDLRGSGNTMHRSGDRSWNMTSILAVMMMKLFVGLGLAALTYIIRDPFIASFIVILTMVFFLALTVMLEFSNLILNPDDYKIIGVLPVSSKTFFAAKMIHLLAYVNALGFLLYFPSAVAAAIANSNPLLFPAFLVAGALSASAIGLSFVLMYTLMLKIADREVMQAVLGYANLTLTLLVYLGYFVMPLILGKESLLVLREYKSDWIYIAPPAWFASIVQIAAGNVSLRDFGAVLSALIVMSAVYRAAMSKLSLGYAQTLAETVGKQEKLKRKCGKGWIASLLRSVTSSEDRAVWPLIRKQFKYDNGFKMSILAIIPLTAIYVFLGLSKGESVPDPFLASMGDGGSSGNFLLYIAAAMFPYLITIGTANSDSYRSAWVFYISPADRTRIILSSARFALLWFCLPFTVLLAGIFTWYFGNPLHAALHCLLVYIILMIQTKILVLLYPRIPFSQAPKTGQRSVSAMTMLFVSMPLLCVPMLVISLVGYGGFTGYGIWITAALITNYIFYRTIKKIIPLRAVKMEFTAPV